MRILIIEDEYLVAAEIKYCLNAAGYAETEHAATEKDALARISEGNWDAAVADANLNGSGIERIADALLGRGIPFMIVTGYGRSSLPANLSEIPVVDKPFRSQALVSAVANLFARPAG
jgi:DNA-binding response OmpR family regulator